MWRGLSNHQWNQIEVHIPKWSKSRKGGRPARCNRRCLEGIIWILWTGSPWSELPRRYGSASTCWRRLKLWESNGTFLRLWRAFLSDLNSRDQIHWGQCFADGSFAPAKKGGLKVGKTKRGKGTKWMLVVDAEGTPLGAHLESASPAEVKLLETTLETISIGRNSSRGRPRKTPKRLIMDRAYDSNPLRKRLFGRGIEPIIPARRNNPNATHQDGRKLRRYRHRWIAERTFAWLGHFRRLVVRYERLIETYAGLFHLACAILTLRKVLK